MDENKLIFLSYATPDRERVMEYFRFLQAEGFDPWLDNEKIVGGQNWDFEIKRALTRAAIIVIFLSANSVNRRAYVQREIKIALDQAQSRLIDDIYMIPVLLDDVPIPPQLTGIHVILSNAENQFADLSIAIRTQLERLGIENARLQGDSKLRWHITWYRDHWDGLPGYEASYQLLRFASEDYPQAPDITEVIKGWLTEQVLDERYIKFEQDIERCCFGQDRFFRQNTWEASCGAPIVRERMVCVSYAIYTMGAGAAHPNHFFKTFAFTLDPVTYLADLASLFEDPDAAFPIIQQAIRHSLLEHNERFPRHDPDSPQLNPDDVYRGTTNWSDFTNFVFDDKGIEIRFAPYQVGAYACGPQFAYVPYQEIVHLVRRQYVHSLGLEHIQRDRSRLPLAAQAALESVDAGPEQL